MSTCLFRSFSSFLIPGGLILMMAVGFLRPHGLPIWTNQLVAALPYGVLAFGLIFGWYFASARTLLSLLVLLAADQAIHLVPPTAGDSDSVPATVFAISAFLLPLNLLAISLIKDDAKDDAVSVVRGLVRLLPIILQPFIVLWLCDPEQEALAGVFKRTYASWFPTGWTPVPQPAVGVFAVAGTFQVVQYAVRGTATDASAFWVLTASFLAYHGTRFGWHAENFFSTAGLILLVSMIQSAYLRTYRDELTGTEGSVPYEEALAQLGRRYTIAVVSIDQLKSYTGSYGNSIARQVFKIIASKTQAACHGGRVFRVSREELTILFNNRSATDSLAALDCVRKTVEATELVLRKRLRVWERTQGTVVHKGRDEPLPVTVSIGVAEKTTASATFGLVLKAAYRAVYDAKASGGNIVRRGVVSADPPKQPRQDPSRVAAADI
ncbi:diguanylate cyclase domain-containing protein [Petrachloros mirabilis]